PAGAAVGGDGCACADAGHASCDDGNACTSDACDARTAACVHAAVSCSDGDPCTVDGCNAATGCFHGPPTDRDHDGICDAIDDGDGLCDPIDPCPRVPHADPTDANGDGIGDACECRDASPGRCIPALGTARRRCALEWRTMAPPLYGHGLPASVVHCADGDASCDVDRLAGQCTFRVLVCIDNRDPRFPSCA